MHDTSSPLRANCFCFRIRPNCSRLPFHCLRWQIISSDLAENIEPLPGIAHNLRQSPLFRRFDHTIEMRLRLLKLCFSLTFATDRLFSFCLMNLHVFRCIEKSLASPETCVLNNSVDIVYTRIIFELPRCTGMRLCCSTRRRKCRWTCVQNIRQKWYSLPAGTGSLQCASLVRNGRRQWLKKFRKKKKISPTAYHLTKSRHKHTHKRNASMEMVKRETISKPTDHKSNGIIFFYSSLSFRCKWAFFWPAGDLVCRFICEVAPYANFIKSFPKISMSNLAPESCGNSAELRPLYAQNGHLIRNRRPLLAIAEKIICRRTYFNEL